MPFCHNCGSNTNQSAMFCHSCGASVRATTLTTTGPAPTALIHDYTTNLGDSVVADESRTETHLKRRSNTPPRWVLVVSAAVLVFLSGIGAVALRDSGALDDLLGERFTKTEVDSRVKAAEAEFAKAESRLKAELAASEKKGYAAGSANGYKLGFENGKQTGYADGEKDGYAQGLADGGNSYDTGYNAGLFDGCANVFKSLDSDAAVGYSVTSRRTGSFYITKSQTC